jgi:maltooligosyltrehalose synthase
MPGPAADRICAFKRQNGDASLVIAAALFPVSSAAGAAWNGTEIPLPADTAAAGWVDLFSGREIGVRDGALHAEDLFATLPVAALVRATMISSGGS